MPRLDKVGKDIGKSTRWGMMQDLSCIGVTVVTQATVTAITEQGIEVEKDGQPETMAAETVVLAAGSTAHNPLQPVVAKPGIAFQVAGDAGRAGLAFDAVHQGHRAGLGI
jgi:2,4-dienoyl-CoA reductase (NADPH2)